MSKYNLSPDEESLARELFFDLGYDNYSTLETYLRSGQSNKDVKVRTRTKEARRQKAERSVVDEKQPEAPKKRGRPKRDPNAPKATYQLSTKERARRAATKRVNAAKRRAAKDEQRPQKTNVATPANSKKR